MHLFNQHLEDSLHHKATPPSLCWSKACQALGHMPCWVNLTSCETKVSSMLKSIIMHTKGSSVAKTAYSMAACARPRMSFKADALVTFLIALFLTVHKRKANMPALPSVGSAHFAPSSSSAALSPFPLGCIWESMGTCKSWKACFKDWWLSLKSLVGSFRIWQYLWALWYNHSGEKPLASLM